MEPLLDTLKVIEGNADYWRERDLSGLPTAFLERLDELKPCSIVKPDPDNIFEPPTVFRENIEKSKKYSLFLQYSIRYFQEYFWIIKMIVPR